MNPETVDTLPKSTTRSTGWIRYLSLLPTALLFGIFFLMPLLLIVLYSFWKVIDYRVVGEWTIDNYRYFFSVPTYAINFAITVGVTLLSTLLAVAFAFPFIYWLVRHVGKRWRLPLLVLIVVPLWTSYLLRIYAWTSMLGRDGAINRLLTWTGLIEEPLSFFLYDRPAVVLVLVYLYFPFAALILYTALESFDWDQLKSAMDLGSRPLRAIRLVMLPQIRPAINTAMILVSIPILGEYLVPQLIGGVKGLMIGNLITNFFSGAQYTRGAAAALLIVILIVAILIVFRRSLELTALPTRTPSAGMQFESRSARWVRRFLHIYGAATYLFLFVPIGLLVLFSFNSNRIGTFPITGWTLEWYRDVFANGQIQAAFFTSLRVSAQVTLIAVVVGVSAAFALVRGNFRFKDGLRVFLTLPIMIPGLLIGISLLVTFANLFDVPLSTQTAVIGQSVFITPFVILVVGARLQSFDRSLEHAANDLGANWIRRFRYVVLPLLFPAFVASALFAFTLSIDEFIITLFLIGGHNTLPMYVYTQLRFGITPEVNALATMLLFASFLLVASSLVFPAVSQRLKSRRGRSISKRA